MQVKKILKNNYSVSMILFFVEHFLLLYLTHNPNIYESDFTFMLLLKYSNIIA